MNLLDMKGRHAVITGGATGLGFAIAQRMLASGARVTIWDRDAAGMTKAAEQLRQVQLGAVVNTVQVDVTEHASVVQATAQTTALAGVDVRVQPAPDTEVWPEHWEVMEVFVAMGTQINVAPTGAVLLPDPPAPPLGSGGPLEPLARTLRLQTSAGLH